MKIIKKRIRNLDNYLVAINENQDFYIGLTDIENLREKLIRIGFTNDLNIGETILPSIIGSISRYNAEGKYIKRKDLPKEEYYIERHWTWTDWLGNEHSKFVYITKERYQRDFIEPPSLELRIENINGSKILLANRLVKRVENYEINKHAINLLLELFGECDILSSDLHVIKNPQILRLNWKILPKGEYPWNKVEPIIKDRIERLPKGNRPVVQHRIEKITSKNPSFLAFGEGGFYDYTVFGFPEKSIYVFESSKMGNATYIFDKDWEELTKLTKKEILDGDLQKMRIVHKDGWAQEIDKIL